MSQDLQRITSFISEHHVMSLATHNADKLSVCSPFYTYDVKSTTFIVASAKETTHIKHIKYNQKVAGNILLETKKVGEIKGLQFRGEFLKLDNTKLKLLYYKDFPYALAMSPELWQIKVDFFKFTDNSLGFGNKIIWEKSTS